MTKIQILSFLGAVLYFLIGLFLRDFCGLRLVNYFDWTSAAVLTFCIMNVTKKSGYWLLYSAATVPFAGVTFYKGTYGYALMGAILIISGLRNWKRERQRENRKDSSTG